MQDNRKSTFEVLVCIKDSDLEQRVSNLCVGAGYEVNRSCFNFFHGIETPELEDTPLIISTESTVTSFPKIDVDLTLSLTQILLIGKEESERDIKGIWRVGSDFKDEDLLMLIAKACIVHELAKENSRYKSLFSINHSLRSIKTASPRMSEILDLIDRIAALNGSILITGESGTGKTQLARYIHSQSKNKKGAFVALSCATFPRDLMESELFGVEKGAYTGATESRAGAVELADKGTLFLDEIGDLPMELQPKLLTFVQDKTFKRLGGVKIKSVSLRIISATNLSLEQMIVDKKFRSDLFYRINTFHLHLPPLRERLEDLPFLAESILARICEERKDLKNQLSNECIKYLETYSWPGNIRELENVIEQAAAFSKDSLLKKEDFEVVLNIYNKKQLVNKGPQDLSTFDELTLKEIEDLIIGKRLAIMGDNKAKTARSLGISLKTLYNKLG